MKFDREAIAAAHAEQEAAKLASFRAGLHNVDTRALRVMATTYRKHITRGTNDAHYAPRLAAVQSELDKPSRALDQVSAVRPVARDLMRDPVYNA